MMMFLLGVTVDFTYLEVRLNKVRLVIYGFCKLEEKIQGMMMVR